jgi:hypothetical protein
MRPRDILAANLRALMATRSDLNTLPKITARSGVSNGTLDRIRRAVVSTRVDELEPLGKVFGLPAWEMLRPPNQAPLSPLAQRLAAHLDQQAGSETAHTAAYAAAIAAIDAQAAKTAAKTAATPTAVPRPRALHKPVV